MGNVTLSIPQTGQLNSTEDPKIASDFTTLQTVINGNLDTANILPNVLKSAGVNAATTVKGFTPIGATDTTTSTSYVLLANADQVTNITMDANGLIAVWYRAVWNSTVNGTNAFAALFLGSNQLKIATSGTSPAVQETTTGTGQNAPLTSTSLGLVSGNANGYTGDVLTGQIVGNTGVGDGGPCWIFASAGTYTVSVKFKVASGATAAVSNRHLYVQAFSFS